MPATSPEIARVVLGSTVDEFDDVVDLVCYPGASFGFDLAAVAVTPEDVQSECAPLSAAMQCHGSSPSSVAYTLGVVCGPVLCGLGSRSGRTKGTCRANYQDSSRHVLVYVG